jgi:4-hydroxybenzoate polyprenyltransferase
LLALVGIGLSLGLWYWLGVAVVAVLLAVEHVLVSPRDLHRLNAAFFTMNGVISIAFFVFVLAEALS